MDPLSTQTLSKLLVMVHGYCFAGQTKSNSNKVKNSTVSFALAHPLQANNPDGCVIDISINNLKLLVMEKRPTTAHLMSLYPTYGHAITDVYHRNQHCM